MADVILADPPYGKGLAQATLDRAPSWLAPGGWIALETHGETLAAPDGLALEAERRFGKATITLLRTG